MNRATPNPISAIRGSSDRSRLSEPAAPTPKYARSTAVAQSAMNSPASASGGRQHHGLDQEQADQPASAGADGEANRNLLPASQTAGQQKPATFAEATSNTSPAATASSRTIGAFVSCS